MCNFFSCILLKDGVLSKRHGTNVLYMKDAAYGDPFSHETIIEKYQLKDQTLLRRSWVRIELTPTTQATTKLNNITREELQTQLQELFQFKWDEQGSVPWFTENEAYYTALCYNALQECLTNNIALNDEQKITQHHNYIILYGKSHAILFDQSRAILYGTSHADLHGISHATLYDDSTAELYSSSHATLRNNSHAQLFGRSHADLYDDAHAKLYGDTHAKLHENSHATIHSPTTIAIKNGAIYTHENAEINQTSTTNQQQQKEQPQ